MKKTLSLLLCAVLAVTALFGGPVTALAADGPSIICRDAECAPGEQAKVEVLLSGNPGIMYLELTPIYSEQLGNPTIANGGLFSDFTIGNQFIFTADNDVKSDGKLVTLTFSVGGNVAEGSYNVGFAFRSAFNYDESSVTFSVVYATVKVTKGEVPLEGIGLSGQSEFTVGGPSAALNIYFFPENATNKKVVWSSSNPSVAAVLNGVVRPLKKGTAFITATADYNGLKASWQITVTCTHSKTTFVPERAATCVVLARHSYTVCDTCGDIVSGSNETYGTYGSHKYVEEQNPTHIKSYATCISPAVYYKVCSVCNRVGDDTYEYGRINSSNHTNRETRNQKQPTLTEAGYTGDIWCADCEKKLSDGNVIPALGKYGDGDRDGEITAADALTALKAAVRTVELTDEQKTLCDVNGDGKVTAVDAMLILRRSVKIIGNFPVEIR